MEILTDTPGMTPPVLYLLRAAARDTVINHRTMVRKYVGAPQRVISGGHHELAGLADYIDEVLAFFDTGNKRAVSREDQ